jgi:hypothetical protein
MQYSFGFVQLPLDEPEWKAPRQQVKILLLISAAAISP